MAKRLPRLIICDDDESFQLGLRYALKNDFEIKSAYNGDEALAIIKNQTVDILLCDVSMRTPDEGIQLIPKVRAIDPDLSIVMSSGNQDFQTVREAMQLGAIDYLPKSSEPEETLHSLMRVIDRQNLMRRQEQFTYETKTRGDSRPLIGQSPSIAHLRNFIDKIRNNSASVVISGETGTGKEVIARMLRSTNEKGLVNPFVAIDSSTIQSSIAESLLFGHEKGAFTGADQMRKGAFEEANGGIIYFDEIANMPLEIQARLLRVIQEKEVTRLGSSRVIPLDFRVVCATNQDLERLVAEGKFKDDLYQRLNVIPIQLPPLRERREDLPLLVQHFVERNGMANRQLRFSEDAMRILESYDWPGNVRELNNLIAYLTAIVEKDDIDVADLPPKLFNANRSMTIPVGAIGALDDSTKTIYERIAEYEKQILIAEFKKQSGNISKMAQSLGMDRSHLYTKLKTYGIFQRRTRAPGEVDISPTAASGTA